MLKKGFELADTAPQYTQFAQYLSYCLATFVSALHDQKRATILGVAARPHSDAVAARERAAQRAGCYRASQFVTAA